MSPLRSVGDGPLAAAMRPAVTDGSNDSDGSAAYATAGFTAQPMHATQQWDEVFGSYLTCRIRECVQISEYDSAPND